MSLYRVHFKWKNKEIQLTAKSLDLTHPYFVSIKDLVFSREQKLIINPAEEDITRAFGNSKHLMIPFQTVILIEEIPEKGADGKVMPFTLMEEKAEAEGDKEGDEEEQDSDKRRKESPRRPKYPFEPGFPKDPED